MEVSNNYINKIVANKAMPVQNQQGQVSYPVVQNQTMLPSIYSTGQSQINTNLPVGYTKLGEISIPGLQEKASLFRLENGQKVVILPKKGPTYVKTTYNVGGLNETDDIKGISHYIEHNLFNGSKGLAPREYDAKVSDLGGRTNASTSYNYTDYYLTLQLHNDNSLEEAIKLNAMQTQYPTFPQDQLDKEKEPVKSEIDMYADMSSAVTEANVIKNLFQIQSTSPDLVAGTKGIINSLTREKVLEYYNTWYTPDNAVTVITGDVDVNETISLVSKYYNKKNDYSLINKRFHEPLNYTNKPIRNDLIMPNASSAEIALGFAIPEGTSIEDRIKVKALLTLLNSSNSILSKAMEEYGLSASFRTDKMQNKPDGASAILCTTNVCENQVEDVIKTIYDSINHIANNPPTQDELSNLKRDIIYSLNTSGEESSSINHLLTNMVINNDLNYFANNTNVIQSLTPQDISNTAKKFLDLNKVAMCVAHSKEATNSSISENYTKTNSAKTVSFGASKNINNTISEHIKDIQRYKLANNIETQILPSSPYEKSTIIMDFDTNELNNYSASALDILNILLSRGNAFKSNDAMLQMKDQKGFYMNLSCDNDGMTAYTSFYTQDMNEITNLLKETIMNPNFTQAEFDRAKAIIKDHIQAENPSAYSNLCDEIFGEKIKSYASKEQRLKELDALTLADIQNLYSQILNTAQVRTSAKTPIKEYPYLANTLNSNLSIGLPIFKPVTTEKTSSYYIYSTNQSPKVLTETNENKQADVVQAYTYKESDNIDDIAKIELLNMILGGGMSSRLFKDLREEQKLAYSVGSKYTNEKDTGAIVLYIGTTTESSDPKEGSPANITKALNGFDKHINKLKTENVSQEELDDIKIQLKTQLLNLVETNDDKLLSMHANSKSAYGQNYNKALLDAIDKVTVDDIRATANYVFANPPITSIVASQNTLKTLKLQ